MLAPAQGPGLGPGLAPRPEGPPKDGGLEGRLPGVEGTAPGHPSPARPGAPVPRRPRRAPRTWPRGARPAGSPRRTQRSVPAQTARSRARSGPRRAATQAGGGPGHVAASGRPPGPPPGAAPARFAPPARPAARGLVRRPRPIAGRRPKVTSPQRHRRPAPALARERAGRPDGGLEASGGRRLAEGGGSGVTAMTGDGLTDRLEGRGRAADRLSCEKTAGGGTDGLSRGWSGGGGWPTDGPLDPAEGRER